MVNDKGYVMPLEIVENKAKFGMGYKPTEAD